MGFITKPEDGPAAAEDRSPLALRMAVETCAAFVSALSVSPAISIVDKAIVSNASGLEPLVPAVVNGIKTLFTSPVTFVKSPSFLLLLGVQFGTYTVANNIEALCERSKRSSVAPKFAGTSPVNVFLSVSKDRAFARMFGTGVPKPMPSASLGLFAMRDAMTIMSSFSLPGTVSQRMQHSMGYSKGRADTLAQLFTPVAVQVLSSPLHLYGLDLYNRGAAVSGADRFAFIRQQYLKTTLARMARIFPAFGVGGVINKDARTLGKAFLASMYPARVSKDVRVRGDAVLAPM